MSEPRILFFDLEVLADLKEVEKVFFQLSNYPGLTIKAQINSIICFGYKWLGDKEVKIKCAWDYKPWNKNVNDDSELVKDILTVMQQADVVVGHNSKSFDWRFLQTRILKHKLTPMHKVIHIDTKQEAKKNLFLFNNKLGNVAEFLERSEKMDSGGQELWTKVRSRDKKSMDHMAKYCKQDVVALEEIFKALRPFMNQIPNYNKFTVNGTIVCPRCESTRIIKRGTGHNKQGPYQKYHCQDCLSWSSARGDKDPVGI